MRAEINSDEWDLQSGGSPGFQTAVNRIHGLLFDDITQAGGGASI